MKTILAVVRESSDRQEMDSQKEELNLFCSNLGYKKVIWIAVQGASAHLANKKYLDMLDSIKNTIIANNIKAVAFWHLNRLGRKESYIMQMKEWFVQNHVQVYVKNPTLTLLKEDGTLDAGANIAWSVFASMVAYDTEEMFTKFKRGKDRNKAEGKVNGGLNTVAFGYTIDESKHIVVDWEAAEIIKTIFTEYATGKYSFHSLAVELTERGIKSKNGKVLHAQVIRKAVNNVAYIGETTERGVTYPAIIDKELFDRANAQVKRPDKVSKETVYTNLCIKLLKCKDCGHNYMMNTGQYVCYMSFFRNSFAIGKERCNAGNIKSDALDSLVWEQVTKRHLNFLSFNKKEVEENREKELAILKTKQQEVTAQIEKCIVQKQRAKQMYIDLDLTNEEYTKQIARISIKEKELDAHLHNIEVNINKVVAYQPTDIITNIAEATKKEKRDIVRMHIDHIYLLRDKYPNKIVEIYYKDGEVQRWYYTALGKNKGFTLIQD